LIGYARLRLRGDSDRALLRELHVYGQMVPLSERPGRRWQHRGYGVRLLQECEQMAAASGCLTLQVTSGVGARDYYRRLGYERAGPYMSKRLA